VYVQVFGHDTKMIGSCHKPIFVIQSSIEFNQKDLIQKLEVRRCGKQQGWSTIKTSSKNIRVSSKD